MIYSYNVCEHKICWTGTGWSITWIALGTMVFGATVSFVGIYIVACYNKIGTDKALEP